MDASTTSHMVELLGLLVLIIALLAFIIMDKFNRLRTLFSAKEDEIQLLRNRIAELETLLANSSSAQSELDSISGFLAERGF